MPRGSQRAARSASEGAYAKAERGCESIHRNFELAIGTESLVVCTCEDADKRDARALAERATRGRLCENQA